MNEGRIIFRVTKAGVAVNSKWKVLLDGKCVGNIDFQNGLQVKTTKGKHTVRYKVGFQSTQVLWVDVGDDDVVVECEWDGTVRNFRVVSVGTAGSIVIILKELVGLGNNNYNYQYGLAFVYAEGNGFYEFGMLPMSKENYYGQ